MQKFLITAELQIRGPANVAEARRKIKQGLNDLDIDVNITGASKAKREVESVKGALDGASSSAENLSKTVAISLKRFATYSIATRAVGLLTSGLAGAVNEAISFEREMIKVSQVSGKTLGQLSGLTREIDRLATTLGVASESLLGVTRILVQAGLTADETKIALEALAKSELAPTFDNITQTAEGAIAIFNQFRQGAGALEKQLGSINAVAGKFAVESGDLIAAVRRVGGVFKASGGELNDLLALFTSIRSTTRESGESIATGLRTIFVRIQRPRTLKFLDEMGVKLTDMEGKFVGPYKAVQRLNAEFSKFEQGDPRFIKVAEEIAGFRQIGKVIPLLQQFKVAEDARQVAAEGANSLTKDSEAAQASLAVQIVKVKEEFLSLVRKVYSSPVFKFMAESSLALASSIIKVGDALKDIIPLIGIFASIKLSKSIAGFFGSVGKNLASPKGFSTGGPVPGSGDGDTVPAMLTPGEFVINKRAAQRIGYSNLQRMNGKKGGGDFKGGVQYLNNGGVVYAQNPDSFAAFTSTGKSSLSYGRGGIRLSDSATKSLIVKQGLEDRIGEGNEFSSSSVKGANLANLPDFQRDKIKAVRKGVKGKTISEKDFFEGLPQDSLSLSLAGPFPIYSLQDSDVGQRIDKEISAVTERALKTAEKTFSGDLSDALSLSKPLGPEFDFSQLMKSAFSTVKGFMLEGAIGSLTGAKLGSSSSKAYDADFDFERITSDQRDSLSTLYGKKISPNLLQGDAKSDLTTARRKGNYVNKIAKSDILRIQSMESDYLKAQVSKEKAFQDAVTSTDVIGSLGKDKLNALASAGLVSLNGSGDGLSQAKPYEISESLLKRVISGDRTGFSSGRGKISAQKLKTMQKKFGITTPDEAFDVLKNLLQLNTGGIVPGSGNRDTVPAMLTPGEVVINKKASQAIGYENLMAMNSGKMSKFNKGGVAGKAALVRSSFDRTGGVPLSNIAEAQAVMDNFIDGLKKFGTMFQGVKKAGVSALSKSEAKEYEGLAYEDGSIGIALGSASKYTVGHETAHQIDRTMGSKAPGAFTSQITPFASQQEGTFQNAVTEKLKPILKKQLEKEGASLEEIQYRLKNEEIFADLMEKTTPKARAILVHTTSAEKGLRTLSALINQAGDIPGLAGLSAKKAGTVPRKKVFGKASYFSVGSSFIGMHGPPKGQDIYPAYLSKGEAVLTPDAADFIGRENINGLNKRAKYFAKGSSGTSTSRGMSGAGGVEDYSPKTQEAVERSAFAIDSFSGKLIALSSGFTIISSVFSSIAEPGTKLADGLNSLQGALFTAVSTVGLYAQIMKVATKQSEQFVESRAIKRREAREPELKLIGSVAKGRKLENRLSEEISSKEDSLAKARLGKSINSSSIGQLNKLKSSYEGSISGADSDVQKAIAKKKATEEAFVNESKRALESGDYSQLSKIDAALRKDIESVNAAVKNRENVVRVSKKNIDAINREVAIRKDKDKASREEIQSIENSIKRRKKALGKTSDIIEGSSEDLSELRANTPLSRGQRIRNRYRAARIGVLRSRVGKFATGASRSVRNSGFGKAVGGLVTKMGGLGNIITMAGGAFIALTQAVSAVAEYMQKQYLKEAEKNLEDSNYNSFRENSRKAARYGKISNTASAAGSGALIGAGVGATVGTFAGPAGTLIGGAVGGTAGALIGAASSLGPGQDFESAIEVESKIIEDSLKKTSEALTDFSNKIISSTQAVDELTKSRRERLKAEFSKIDIENNKAISEISPTTFGEKLGYGLVFAIKYLNPFGLFYQFWTSGEFRGAVVGAFKAAAGAVYNFAGNVSTGIAATLGIETSRGKSQRLDKELAQANALRFKPEDEKKLQRLVNTESGRLIGEIDAINSGIGTDKSKSLETNRLISSFKNEALEDRRASFIQQYGDENGKLDTREQQRLDKELAFLADSLGAVEEQAKASAFTFKEMRRLANEITKIQNESLKSSSAVAFASNTFANAISSASGEISGFQKNISNINLAKTFAGASTVANKAIDENVKSSIQALGLKEGSRVSKQLEEEAEFLKGVNIVKDNIRSSLSSINFKTNDDPANQQETVLAQVDKVIGDSDYGKKLVNQIRSVLSSTVGTGNTVESQDLISAVEAGIRKLEPLEKARLKLTEEVNKLTIQKEKFEIDSLKKQISLQNELSNIRLESSRLNQEAAGIIESAGGREAPSDDVFAVRRQNILNREAGISSLNSPADISASIKETLSALESERVAISSGKFDNDPSGFINANERINDLTKAMQNQASTIRDSIKAKQEEIDLISKKNKLEKDSLESLIKGDIQDFFKKQSAIGATAAVSTGDDRLVNLFGASALGEATSSLREQKEAGVTEVFGQKIDKVLQDVAAAGLGRRGLDPATAQAGAKVIADSTKEQEKLNAQIRNLGGNLIELGNAQIRDGQFSIDNATIEISRIKEVIGRDIARQEESIRRRELALDKKINKVGNDSTAPQQQAQAASIASSTNANTNGRSDGLPSGAEAPRATNDSKPSYFTDVDVKNFNTFLTSVEKLSSAVESLAKSKIKIDISPVTVSLNVSGPDILGYINKEARNAVADEVRDQIKSMKNGSF